MKLIKEFKDLKKTDVSIAGGKGASLGEMTKAGIPVPKGFVVLSEAFEKFIQESELNAETDAILDTVNSKEMHTVENASEKIQAMILDSEMPEDIKEEIETSFKKLRCKFVAVRSSATAEDSASAAWAGQLDSYLNTTKNNLLENVKKCWASLFTPRAIFYRFEKRLDKERVSVAVVVQEMINSKKSGIAFSVHPVTQDRNQLIIEAGFGLGEAIVSGQITPDNYVVDKETFEILDKSINVQTKALYRNPKGGNEWRELGRKGEEQVLDDKNIIKLAKLIVKIEEHYGFPVDVEFAVEKNKFYIVQSRPITTLQITQENEMVNIGHLDDYQRMFQVEGMPYFGNDNFMGYYKTLHVLTMFDKGIWISYLPKKIIQKTLKEGVEIYCNKKNFNRYHKDFGDFKKHSDTLFNKINKKKITKKEISEFLKLGSELFRFYSKTEFFYTDSIFSNAKNEKQKKELFKKVESIKNPGREFLNKMFFGKKAYFVRILSKISKQFGINEAEIFSYTRKEIIDLFDRKKVSGSTLKERSRNYLSKSDGRNVINRYGEEAKKLIMKFKSTEKTEKNVLKGVTANKGKAKGRAIVIPYSFEKFDKFNEIMKDMKRGQVLVAETTSPEFIVACKKASAILTNQGGLMSHAAIISRELGIPCIVALGDATKVIKNDDELEVDANKGMVKIINKHK